MPVSSALGRLRQEITPSLMSVWAKDQKNQPTDQDTESHWGRHMEKERTLEKELGKGQGASFQGRPWSREHI